MRIRNSSQFIHYIGDEFSWRHKELLELRLLTRSSNIANQRILIRAGVPLAYAHWEGFVKAGSELLLNFVSHQNLQNDQLADPYFAHSVKSQMAMVLESARPNTVIEAACFVRDAHNKKAEIRHKNYVDTVSNLSSDVFQQIAGSLGIDLGPYRHLYPYIDETIVNNRNKIAHGEFIQLSVSDFHALVDRVADLMRMYKTDLENIVISNRFKAAA